MGGKGGGRAKGVGGIAMMTQRISRISALTCCFSVCLAHSFPSCSFFSSCFLLHVLQLSLKKKVFTRGTLVSSKRGLGLGCVIKMKYENSSAALNWPNASLYEKPMSPTEQPLAGTHREDHQQICFLWCQHQGLRTQT